MNSTAEPWLSAINAISLSPPIASILMQTGLDRQTDFPDASTLNALTDKVSAAPWCGPQFKAQGLFADDESRYYEQIIAEDRAVPTRENSWHDLFNALIWLNFPQTKQYLNSLHMHDIAHHGVHPRTPRRNHITHFDECGVVLAVPSSSLAAGNQVLAALAQHQWHEAFNTKRDAWGRDIFPLMFGHANLEMLLSPFIGLTGKWLAVKVCDHFSELTPAEQYKEVDRKLLQRCVETGDFTERQLLRPLPILGVPGWYENQTTAFYQNEDYFRPKRNNVLETLCLLPE